MKKAFIILLTLITVLITSPAFALNRVLSLDGDGDYVEISDSGNLNAINSQVTMEAWIKATAFPNAWISIIYKGDKQTSDACENRSYVLFLNSSGFIHLASAPSGQGQMYLNSPEGLIALNKWYHVVGIIDTKSGVMRILINGVEVARRDSGKDIHLSALPLRIGGSHEEYVSEQSPFAGQIDEVRIWNITRTQEEIQETMHTALSGKEPGLVGYWRFDDAGNIAIDSSKSHADGKLMGDAHFVEVELPKPGELVVPAVISGIIKDEAGKPIPNAAVSLEQNEKEITQTQADASGNYRIALFQQARGQYDLSATSGGLGAWQFGILLRVGEQRTLSLTLKKAINIEGTLLMLDDKTPHVAVSVQVLCDGKVIAGTFSDENGKYRFINLKPGHYQVRCQIMEGYVYYRQVREAIPQSGESKNHVSRFTFHTSYSAQDGEILQVHRGKMLSGIDFGFAPFKKGIWQTYRFLDGLAHNDITGGILQDKDGAIWIGTSMGVSRYDGKSWITYTQKDGLVNNSVDAILQDKEGVMWFGTRGGGVSCYDGKSWITYTQKDGLAHNEV
ncbi:hypothetical protein FJZ31_08785 [Candidatus Poribacteria bacterium]|nr:hypothetical protein [Candidatus Poribacteria bacterium]